MSRGRTTQRCFSAIFLVWTIVASPGCGDSGPGGPAGGSGGTGGSATGGAGGSPAPSPGTGGTGGADAGTRAPDAALVKPDAARPDMASPTRDAGAPAEAGAPVAGDVLAACTPQTVNVTVQQPDRGGGLVFATRIADPQATFKMIAIKVCSALYASTMGLTSRPTIGLTIADPGSGVAFTSPASSRITFNAGYIAGLGGNATAVQYEIEGVIAHESVHIYQVFGGPTWLTEGIADAIRFRTGYFKITNRRPGGNFNDSYQTTGFFLAWVDDMYPGVLGKLNLMNPKNEASFMALTGKPIQMLWDEYQAAIKP
jgi:hypothetical protein